jgi:hypothetical protein
LSSTRNNSSFCGREKVLGEHVLTARVMNVIAGMYIDHSRGEKGREKVSSKDVSHQN